ncbi:hypothetical protein SH2C18_47990 [Clostridium sediminicola]|uniref:acyltransferase n=1 Tax=Clostridium sediminicola TaxID=3114879 RepID=UPI0031F1C719
MKRKLKNFISVIYTLLKFSILKLIHGSDFKFYCIERFSPNTEVDIGKGSRLYLGEKVRAHSGVKLRVRETAKLIVGKNTAFNYGCMVTSHQSIKIGENSILGPNVLIYDHDHDFRAEDGLKLKYKTSPVEIGNNVWIGANTVILRGTKIGDNCVIGAGSVIRGDFPNDSIIVQKKETIIKKY